MHPRGAKMPLPHLRRVCSVIYRPVYSLQPSNARLSCTLKLKQDFLWKYYTAKAINGPAEWIVKSPSRFQYLCSWASLYTVTKLGFCVQIGNYVDYTLTFMFTFSKLCLWIIPCTSPCQLSAVGISLTRRTWAWGCCLRQPCLSTNLTRNKPAYAKEIMLV